MNALNFIIALDVLMEAMGPPDFQHFYPIAPVPRTSGKPYKMSKRARERLLDRGDAKSKRKVQQAEAWDRMLRFRDAVMNITNSKQPGKPFDGALVAVMIFYVPRPKKHPRKNAPILPTTRPDSKNFMWAMEDALNPRYETIKGMGRKVMIWPGLWRDDSQVTTLPVRKFADSPDGVGIHLIVWQIDNAAAS